MIVERTFERTRHRVAPVWHPRKGFEVFPRRNTELSPKISPRGISIVVVRRLAEPNTRVRFPYPAPNATDKALAYEPEPISGRINPLYHEGRRQQDGGTRVVARNIWER